MPTPTDPLRELQVLEQIESDSEVTQAGLASTLGVAVGTINFVVRRMVKKGYIRVKQMERRRLKYIITPEGIALRAKLAMDSIRYSMQLYRETRAKAQSMLAEVRRTGHRSVFVDGDGDLADVVRLTCLEQEMKIVSGGAAPTIKIQGMQLTLENRGDPIRAPRGR